MSTHVWLHIICDPGHAHAPFLQLPLGHSFPQVPQLLGSVIRSGQPPSQGCAQVGAVSSVASTTDASGGVVPASTATTAPASSLVETVWNPQMDAHADADSAIAGRRSAMARERITVPASQYPGSSAVRLPQPQIHTRACR
jgi:hypothetical protein